MFKRVHIIINPAAGQPQPLLHTFNQVFQEEGIDWNVVVTKDNKNAMQLAKKAAESGNYDVVAACGGDGTVTSVANGLYGTHIPVAVIPAGTANLLAAELGIPFNLAAACRLLANGSTIVRNIDMAFANDRLFLYTVGIGFNAETVKVTSREAKTRFGILAFIFAGIQLLQQPEIAHYTLKLDEETVETDGLTCLVTNSGSLGGGLSLAPGIDINDGLLDVIVIRNADFASSLSLASSIFGGTPDPNSFQRWQTRTLEIITDPPQPIQADGDMWGETPLTAEVLPSAMPVVVPGPRG